MLKNVTSGLILSLFLAAGVAYADDAPTLDQVYKAAQSGKMDDAQKMMDVVLKEHPNSAKAHYVEAELLAKQGQMSRAEEELNNAERLKPGLPFASPQSVQELKSRISSTHRTSQSEVMQPVQQGGFPWGMLLLGGGVIVLLVFIMRALSARNNPQAAYQPAPAQSFGGQPAPFGQPAPYGQPYGAPAAGGGMGSGIMGGLATGAAVGVGMVAGEALAHHFMDDGHGTANAAPVSGGWTDTSSNNMGGNDFGITDNSSWGDNSSIASSDDSSDWG